MSTFYDLRLSGWTQLAVPCGQLFYWLCEKKTLPDNKIAENPNYKVGYRIKSWGYKHKVVKNCKQKPFSIWCDEGNGRGATLVRIFKDKSRPIKTRFIDMPVMNIGTGQNLFYAIPSISSVNKCIIHFVD